MDNFVLNWENHLDIRHVEQLPEHKDGGGLERLLDELHGGGAPGILGEQHELLQRVHADVGEVDHREQRMKTVLVTRLENLIWKLKVDRVEAVCSIMIAVSAAEPEA